MNAQISVLLSLTVVSVCSIGFVLMLPALASMAMRGNRAGVVRQAALVAGLVAVALAFAALLGAWPAAYSVLG